MRKRIYRISEDKFDDLKPNIEFERDSIDIECPACSAVDDSFVIKSTNGIPIRGMAYCSNPYVKIREPQFEGSIVSISFTVDNIFAKAGEMLSGVFTILAVGIEKEIPFTITYVKEQLNTSFGVIDSLETFAASAQGRFSEAVGIFYSEAFARFINTLDKRTRLLYRGFRSAAISPTNVDEFLVACGLKETMVFDLRERTDKYYGVSENIRGEIEITRNTWGFIDIEVSCDADFVSVEKNHITADFFLGSIFNMSYYIHKEKMHAGLNFAKITFDYRTTHKEIIIMATADQDGIEISMPAHERNVNKLKLFRDYESFRLRKLSNGQWCNNTVAIIDSGKVDISENMGLLYKALVYITNKQKQEALWIIQDLKRTIENKQSAEWAFLLYLCTLIEREESYVDRITDDIEYIYKEHTDDVLVFWFLLQLRKEYVKNPTAKLRAIASKIDSGIESPVLFIEAYFVFLQDPYLITSFDKFTLKILRWAKKHGAITRDIAIQMVHVLETQRVFIQDAVSVLEACYEIYENKQFLLAIVTYLLKADKTEPGFAKWFRMAIDKDLHVPGIFEAYMDCVPMQSVERLPQLVTMFFKYNNDLSYEKKALLYANIILHKNEDEDTYKQYDLTIEKFALEQLKLGRIDDNLAICYQQLLETGLLDSDNAKLLMNFVFKKKVAVIYPNIRRVLLFQEEYKNPVIANVKEHQAYISYIGSEGAIFLEDSEGHLIADPFGYFLEDIMDTTGKLQKIKDLCSDSFALIVNDIAAKKDEVSFITEDVNSVELFLHSPQIAEDFRIKMYPKIIEFLRLENREEILEKHFENEANLEALPVDIVSEVIEIFIIRSRYDEAYHMLTHTNGIKVKLDVATKLCQYMINKKNNQVDDFLISLTAYLIGKDMIHKDMVTYLVQNYIGPTDLLLKIYHNGYEMGLDVAAFAERILIQSIYRDFLPENIIEVFDTYMVRKTNKMIVEAFLTFEAHAYLSTNEEVAERVFAYIFNRIAKEMPVNESMRIALLKFLCLEPKLEEDELNMLDMLLGDAIIRNQYFGFYQRCDKRLQVKYHLYDKHFIEFKCDRRKAVVITYSINGKQIYEDEMIEMYDGLYVKEFVLFFGDELRYEIYCDELSNDPLLSGNFINSDSIDETMDGRYGLMNNICQHMICQDADELLYSMKRYQGLDSVTNELFKTI